MGTAESQSAHKLDHHLVIVGGSFAGFAIAEKTWDDFQVTIIDRKDFYDSVIATPRCIVQKDYFD